MGDPTTEVSTTSPSARPTAVFHSTRSKSSNCSTNLWRSEVTGPSGVVPFWVPYQISYPRNIHKPKRELRWKVLAEPDLGQRCSNGPLKPAEKNMLLGVLEVHVGCNKITSLAFSTGHERFLQVCAEYKRPWVVVAFCCLFGWMDPLLLSTPLEETPRQL